MPPPPPLVARHDLKLLLKHLEAVVEAVKVLPLLLRVELPAVLQQYASAALPPAVNLTAAAADEPEDSCALRVAHAETFFIGICVFASASPARRRHSPRKRGRQSTNRRPAAPYASRPSHRGF